MKKIIAQNKKAWHDYHIDKTYEAGIVLTGSEIKSVRTGKVQMRESFARIKDCELFLHNMHISPIKTGDLRTFEETRTRKLLLHKREISYLTGKTKEKGQTLIPLALYFKGHLVKIEIGLGRGKKLYDKRKVLAERTVAREIDRAIKDRRNQ